MPQATDKQQGGEEASKSNTSAEQQLSGKQLDEAFRIIFRSPHLLMKDAIEVARVDYPDCPEVQNLVRFFLESKRGVVKQTEED